jgi:hypothetical protein
MDSNAMDSNAMDSNAMNLSAMELNAMDLNAIELSSRAKPAWRLFVSNWLQWNPRSATGRVTPAPAANASGDGSGGPFGSNFPLI